MGGVVTEEHAISRARYLDLVYSKPETLYDLIPNASHPNTNPTKPPAKTPVDGVVGSIRPPSTVKLAMHQSSSTTTYSTPTISSKVNAIQYS